MNIQGEDGVKSNLWQESHTKIQTDLLESLFDGSNTPRFKDLAERIERLQECLENALILAGPDSTVEGIAQDLWDRERELIDSLARDWTVLRLMKLLREKRRSMDAKNRPQLSLPGFDPFPAFISFDHKRREFGKATRKDLKRYLVAIRKRQKNAKRIVQVEALIELMGKYRAEGPRITLAEVIERESGV